VSQSTTIAVNAEGTTNATRTSARALVALLAAALLLFLPFVGRRDIVTSHEARVVQTARQMADVGWPWNARTIDVPPTELSKVDGVVRLSSRLDAPPLAVNPWMVPVLNGRVRLEKPPIPYWCSATMFRLFGYGEARARLPCAILGVLATLMIFDLGRRLLGSEIGGWISAGVWLSSYFVFDEFRKTMADPYLAFFTLACVWAWVRATTENVFLVTFYLSLALGVLAKGPVILPQIIVPIVAFHICYGWRRFPRWLGHAIGIPLFVIVAAPWFLYVLRHVPHAIDMWRYESVGVFGENTENPRPWWFYFPNLLMIALPWTPMVFVGAIESVKRNRRALFPLIWYVAIVLFFSAANLKKNAYLLPMMPAQTLLVAAGIVAWIDGARGATFNRRRALIAFRNISIALAITVFVVVNFVMTTRENRRSPKPACNVISAELAKSTDETVLTSNLPPEATVYLPLGIEQNASAKRVLILIDTRVPKIKYDDESLGQMVGRPDDHIEKIPVNGTIDGRWRLFRVVLVRP
jgi:4-amino-4-deoxy-L-arabinose transferase-like glycosyltransferase